MLPVSDYNLITKTNSPVYKQIQTGQIDWLGQWQSLGKIKIQLLVFLGLLLIALFTTQLVFASSLATDGQKLSEINSQISKLETENTNLKVQISQESSLTQLSQKAQQMGFSQPSKIISP